MKIRPQILASMIILGIIGMTSMFLGFGEVTTGCVAGIVALGTQLLESNSGG